MNEASQLVHRQRFQGLCFRDTPLSDDVNLLMKLVKKSFTQKIKWKTTATLVLFCFYRKKYGPKHGNKVSLAHKTAIFENGPIMHCKLSINQMHVMYDNGLCLH